MEAGIAAFDPNDLICYSPEESEDEGEPPPAEFQRPASPLLPPPPPPPVAAPTPSPAIDLAAISGEEIQLTVPSPTTTASPLQGARFKCKFCPAYTHTAEDFIKHFIMHFGRNRISYKQMTREEVRALPNANEKFVCGVCARCFEAREAVKEHMIKDHGFKEIKPKEANKPSESSVVAAPTGSVPQAGTKRKLDDDFVDSQKLPISDSSSSSSEAASESKPGSAASSATASKAPQVAISSKPAIAGSAASASAVLPVVCDSETPKSSAIQQQQPPSTSAVAQPKLDEAAEDAELNEFLQPMTLKALKLKLLAGLKLKCPQKGCVYKFETRAKRDIHLKCHNIEPGLIGPGGPVPSKDEKKDNFKCYQCGLEFPRWRECSQHLWKQHKVDSNMLKCPVCDVRFEFAVKVYRHLQTHRPVKAYSCPSCGKSFATQSQLSVHEALHKKQLQQQRPKPKPAAASAAGTSGGSSGPDGKGGDPGAAAGDAEDEGEPSGGEEGGSGKPAEKLPWYAERKCDICGHMFSNSKILSKHIKTVHHKIKPFICNVCGYKSARKVTLTIHMRQHSGLKPLECKECPFRTADPSALKYHEKRHSKDKWYECKFCGLLTIQASALKTHIRLNHPKEYESIKCDLCNFTSVNPELLSRHKSDHKAGLIKSEDSHDSVSSKRSKNAPESSSDCFLPIESTDSVVHDAGGFTIPAVINAPVAHSEETQFPT
uniref:Zinc finger protein 697 n=1 Tax=Culex pipiens TaxID=7175 RepID=A0A8D8HXT4_CULPI